MYIAALDIGGTKTIAAILNEIGGNSRTRKFSRPNCRGMECIWKCARRQ